MLKNNNKGYFLAETIIVLTVVALAITTLYVNSMESYVKEKNELTKYNTVDGLYSANAVKKYLYKYVNDFKVNANTNGYIDVNNYLNGQSIKVNNVTFFKELNVKQLYFSTYDMTKLISSGVLKKNIQKELSNIENDSKCTYRYIVIYNDYSYSLVGVSCGEEEEEIQTIAKFNYTGSEQTYTVPMNGYYKIEAWGAQGGNVDTYSSIPSASGGKGAYTYGEIYLEKGTNLYIHVGGQGSKSSVSTAQIVSGGYNGGGATGGQSCCNRSFASGGGATDIRLSSGVWNNDASLKSRIMVAAGGGGAFNGSNVETLYNQGGYGGSLVGGAGSQGTNTSDQYCYGLGATQTSGGKITTDCAQASSVSSGVITGLFGIGGGIATSNSAITGGGGGYYGGSNSGHIASAGGGSSYVSGYAGCVAIASSSSLTPKSGCTDGTTNIECSYHYSNKIFQNAKMVAGNDKMPNHDGTGTITGNSGNGYAKITYCGYDQASCQGFNASFDYTGSEQTYIAPVDGYYNLEVWGAQGDVVADTGFGGYSAGNVKLNKGDTLYVVVGQKGQYSGIGGYNGGGRGSTNNDSTYGYSTGGGGATHIASVKGTLSSIVASNKDKVYIVAGAGGGHSGWQNNGTGGSAGGYVGSNGTGQTATGGSQTTGGSGDSATAGNFGLGGSIILGTHSAGGGGAGFYGGGSAGNGGGAGGSGYIGNSLLTNKVMYCYNCTASNDTSTKTVSTTNVSANPVSKSAKKGNGYAKITYCGTDQASCNSN